MSVSKRQRFRVLVRDRFTCRYCGRSAPEVVLHVDHVLPVCRGGTDDEANLVAACRDCNSSKSGKLLPDVVAATERRRRSLARAEAPANPDGCSKCRNSFGDFTTYEAVAQYTDLRSGYLTAVYECARGHTWTTYWSAALFAKREAQRTGRTPGRDAPAVGNGAPS